MKKLFRYFIFILLICSCAIKKPPFQVGKTVSAHGLLLIISDSPERYFVGCHEIIDTVDILRNILIERNLDHAIFLHKMNSTIDFFILNENMKSFILEDGILLKAKLVNITYTELITGFKPVFEKTELQLNDTTIISFIFNGGIHRIDSLTPFEVN